MRNIFKKTIIVALLVLALSTTAVLARKLPSLLPRDSGGVAMQVFTPPATSPVVTISGAGDVDVSDYKIIMFQDDVTIYWGSDSSNTFVWIANKPLGVAAGVTTIHVDAATAMAVM